MAEFPSVLEAVTAAAEIQQELGVRNATLDPERQMQFRIGINLGDVMVEGDDLFGEGVNIAARLESVAEPGGICISGTVHDQVKNKLSLTYDYLGARQVKNISENVPVYRVDIGTGGSTRTREEKPAPDDVDGPEDMADTLGSLGERIGRMIDDNVESEILADRIADKLEGKELGEFIKKKVEQGTQSGGRSGFTVPVVVARRYKPGARLIVILGGLALADWAFGGEWWSQWVALGVGAIITLRLVSRMGRRTSA